VDNTILLKKFLDNLDDSSGQAPRLFVDLEGNNLSRHGTISLITVLLESEKEVYLIDVTTLGHITFTTRGVDDQNFQSVLESPKVIKVFFDIRNDSDALFSLSGIRVAGIEDLQLMELASRTFPKRHVNGLAKCIERDASINFLERRKWQAIKGKGQDLFDPSRGGSYAL
ncbi:hypothetical protein CERZMDRAFT_16865, partial [Cercospora zeae-maydis SCOH1-5]